jgi:hypothetical protein
MEEKKTTWRDKRVIAVVRQSLNKEGAESTKDHRSEDGSASTAAQLDNLRKIFERLGMRYVDKVVLDGVPASAPARISEIVEQLFERKKTKNDFDVIAWQVEDRASRGGGEHGMWLQHEANRHGLLIFFPGDDVPPVAYGSVVRVAKYEAAKESSVSTGRRSTQGQTWAQKKGFYRTAGPTPLGCDRIYYGDDDKPKFIIHNLADGRQEQWEYPSLRVIGRYGTAEKKSKNRFRKQKNEYSLLYPGDKQRRRVVRVIFYLRYKRGWRGCKIADYLNRLGIPSPKGKEWSQRQVEIIYENEAYTGVTFNTQTFSGRYFRRDREMGFVALDRDVCELVNKKTFAPTRRPMEEWERIDQPHMYDFLPHDLRDLAIPALHKMWEEQEDPTRPKKKSTAFPASHFLLSNRLHAIQDGGLLTGTMTGREDHQIPYYRHHRARKGRRKGSVFNKLIPANPLHEALIGAMAEAMMDTPELRAKLTAYVEANRVEMLKDQPDVPQLENERDEVKQQISTIVRCLTGTALADAQEELQRLGARRNAIEAKLQALNGQQTRDTRPVDVVVEQAIKVLERDRKRLLSLPIEPLRNLVDAMLIDAAVDMETKNVALTIALPVWATAAPKKEKQPNKKAEIKSITAIEAEDTLCPAQSTWSLSSHHTHPVVCIEPGALGCIEGRLGKLSKVAPSNGSVTSDIAARPDRFPAYVVLRAFGGFSNHFPTARIVNDPGIIGPRPARRRPPAAASALAGWVAGAPYSAETTMI